jgi:hypothetical protein
MEPAESRSTYTEPGQPTSEQFDSPEIGVNTANPAPR